MRTLSVGGHGSTTAFLPLLPSLVIWPAKPEGIATFSAANAAVQRRVRFMARSYTQQDCAAGSEKLTEFRQISPRMNADETRMEERNSDYLRPSAFNPRLFFRFV